MKSLLLTILIIIPLFIGCSFSPSPSKKKQSNYHIDKVNRTISSEDRETKIELPFDFREYQLWEDKYDMGEIEDKLYFPAYFEDDSLLTEHYFKKWNNEDIIPSFYYNFVTNKTDAFILQCICCHLKKDIPSLIYQIATWNGNSYIDGITCFKSLEDHDWKEQSFKVSKDLEIILYHNQLNDDASIIKQDITAKFVINNEGKFIRVE